MRERRKKADWPIYAVLVPAVVLLSLGLYVAGYFALGRLKEFTLSGSRGPGISRPGLIYGRVFPHEWQATIYKPAARVEGWVRDKNYVAVHIAS